MKSAPVLAILLAAWAVAAPPKQSSVETILGPKAFHDGDVIEITDVQATSPKLEQGDSLTVRGRYRLRSQPAATLSLYLTQIETNEPTQDDPRQKVRVKQGSGDFELKTTITHRGVLHVTFYNVETGRPCGGVYFGTPKQMKSVADWPVGYYTATDAAR